MTFYMSEYFFFASFVAVSTLSGKVFVYFSLVVANIFASLFSGFRFLTAHSAFYVGFAKRCMTHFTCNIRNDNLCAKDRMAQHIRYANEWMNARRKKRNTEASLFIAKLKMRTTTKCTYVNRAKSEINLKIACALFV